MKIKKEEIKRFFDKLVSKGVINKEDILFDDEQFNFNKEELIKICESGSAIRLNSINDKLEYQSGDQWIECPTMADGIELSTIFLCDRIPQYTWNTDEEESSVVNNEIESIYTCCIIASICKEDFLEEFLEILRDYKEEEIRSGNVGQGSFTYLLNDWKSLQSKQIQAICSACKENITSKKELFSSLNVSTLEKEARIKLRDLKFDIKLYFNEFKRQRLNDEAIKNLKKHELYKLYDERDTYIKEQIINNSKYASVRTIYFLDKLNYEDVPLLVKKKIVNAAKLEVKEIFKGEDVAPSIREEYKNKLLRKGVRVFLKKWKNQELEQYLMKKGDYVLPTL